MVQENSIKKINSIIIIGPTACGKTALSIELAKKINGEIVSCDSMQIYDEMQIGTARVTNDEMQGIKHYMVGMVKPTKRYSVSEYKKDTTTNPVGSIVVGHDTVLLSRDISKRTIKVYPAVNSKKSYVRINMEVLAPKWGEGGIAFMDAQYAGYIVAELKFN